MDDLALNCILMSELQLYTGRDDETIYCHYFRTAVLRHAFLHQSFSKRFVAWPRSLSSMAINDLLNVLEVVLD
jgi:hypothetical protein